jgi:hypothetical protein
MSFVQSSRPPLRQLWQAAAVWFFGHFFALLLAGVSLAQWVTGAWLVSVLGHPLPAPIHFAGALTLYAINRKVIGTMRGQRDGRSWQARVLRGYSGVAFTALFCAVFLGLSTLGWATVRLLLGALTVEAGTTQPVVMNSARSAIDGLFHWFSVTGVSTITLAFAYGYTIGQWRLTVTQLRVPLAYPPALRGLRIAQISDIHIGQNLTAAQLQRFVARVNALDPDLICITGDIADGPAANLSTQLPILAALRARLGVFAILGNHDHYAGADRVEAELRQYTPFTILRNAIATVEVRGTRLHIVGVDDVGRDWARGVHRHQGLAALESQLSSTEPVLLLSHRPEPFSHAAALGIGLTLSGHTHGGQVAMPWFGGRPRGLARFVTPFDQGLFEKNGCFLYVNRGLGVTGQRIRLFAPREISVIEVAAA